MLPHLAAFGVALVVALGIRLGAGRHKDGSARGRRFAGLGVALGFIVGLSLMAGFTWSGIGPVNRIGHIAVGAVFVGLALDFLTPAWARWAVLTVFALGCGWASALGGLTPKTPPSAAELGLVVLLGILWLGVMVRFSMLTTHKPTTFIVVLAVVTGLAVLSAITGDNVLARASLCLIAAIFAYVVISIFFSIELNYVAMVPVAASVLAIAWALSQRQPETMVGLPVLALILFAERTARRLPMPKGGIATYLYLAALIGCCAIPILIAALLVSAGTSA